MNLVRYVKSFSQGQITIPKEFRKAIGLKESFWLKLSINKGKIIAEPTEREMESSVYLAKILSIKGDWLVAEEIQQNRLEVEKRIKKPQN